MLNVIVHLQCIAELSLCIFALALLECRLTLRASWISFVWVLVVAALMVFCSLCWCQQRNFVFQNKCGLYISCQTPAYVQYQCRTGILFMKSSCGNSNPHDICYHLKEFRGTVPQMINQTAFNSENDYLINAFRW